MVKSPQASGLVSILFGVGIWLDKQLVQEAVDCFGEALAFCIIDNEDIPKPSSAHYEGFFVKDTLIQPRTSKYSKK